MHLPGQKNTNTAPEISEPVQGRRMEDQSLPQMVQNPAEANPTGATRTHGFMHPHPDPAHVYQEGVNQPGGANAIHDPKRGLEAGQQPMNNTTQGPSTLQGGPNAQGVEEKLPFKEQVRAYHKIHRGTLLGDHEQKETGEKILAGEIPPQ